VRFALSGGLVVATLALCGCSSPSIPPWAMAAPRSHYLMEKRMAQHYKKKMNVAPNPVHPEATYEGSYIPVAPSKSDSEPFSEEWQHDQETKQRQFDSLLAICRGC
jgi:hypothetical protein